VEGKISHDNSFVNESFNKWQAGIYAQVKQIIDISLDDVRINVILTAILAYMASEDPVKTSRERIVLPANATKGQHGIQASQLISC